MDLYVSIYVCMYACMDVCMHVCKCMQSCRAFGSARSSCSLLALAMDPHDSGRILDRAPPLSFFERAYEDLPPSSYSGQLRVTESPWRLSRVPPGMWEFPSQPWLLHWLMASGPSSVLG